VYLFIVGDFFRRRRWKRADDEMPATPLLYMLLFWIFFGMGVLSGALAITNAMTGSMFAATVSGCASGASLAGAVVLWFRLNR